MNNKEFSQRHIGSSADEAMAMYKAIGMGMGMDKNTLENTAKADGQLYGQSKRLLEDGLDYTLMRQAVFSRDDISKDEAKNPKKKNVDLDFLYAKEENFAVPEFLKTALSETEYTKHCKEMMDKNKVFRCYIGRGYYGAILPKVIKRSLLENPTWYTSYTPYQAEISQGRLEALLNFQTLVSDLTGMPIANASLLDEATAAAEAVMLLLRASKKKEANKVFVAAELLDASKAVLATRLASLCAVVVEKPLKEMSLDDGYAVAILPQLAQNGNILEIEAAIKASHANAVLVAVSADLLSLMLLRSPGECGADAVYGSAQRLGLPYGFGGPHAGFLAVKTAFQRELPGRLIGVSKDAEGRLAYRMAIQTREQHIRKEKATSNICTAQALLASINSMYAVYHGASGMTQIALDVHGHTLKAAKAMLALSKRVSGFVLQNLHFFDTLTMKLPSEESACMLGRHALAKEINLCHWKQSDGYYVSFSFDETVGLPDVADVIEIFEKTFSLKIEGKIEGNIEGNVAGNVEGNISMGIPSLERRKEMPLKQDIFKEAKSETQMLRYLRRLADKDVALDRSMIPLGSCTMKLNATAQMEPLSWEGVGNMHPMAAEDQCQGYKQLLENLGLALKALTGFKGLSFQPNSGAQGEYAGLLTIRKYFLAKGDTGRNVAFIPPSAHGTNFASAVMAGFRLVSIPCLDNGCIDKVELQKKCQQYKDSLGVFMITYPSTYGMYEANIQEICALVHEVGGFVYLDGANMNAQVGYMRPADIGADICHLNLHKTFAIPHGGGGPGMGPILCTESLAAFLPAHPNQFSEAEGREKETAKKTADTLHTQLAQAAYGSASILIISYAYIRLLGFSGMRQATARAVLHANYLKQRLSEGYKVLFAKEAGNRVAHELIIDLREFQKTAGIRPEDVAKRLIDYGYHAPTLSWPVAGTLMIEPTESESKAELDRFAEAMLTIRAEIREIEQSRMPKDNNLLKNAPHPAENLLSDSYRKKIPYSAERAAFPLSWIRKQGKYWPPVSRIDNVHGDRNLFCVCPPAEAYDME